MLSFYNMYEGITSTTTYKINKINTFYGQHDAVIRNVLIMLESSLLTFIVSREGRDPPFGHINV